MHLQIGQSQSTNCKSRILKFWFEYNLSRVITPDLAQYSYPNNSRIPSFFSSSKAGSSYSPKFTFLTYLESLNLVNFSTAAFYRQATVEDEESPKMINVTFDADVIAYQMSPGSHSDKPGIFISGKCLRYIQVISLSKLKCRKIQSLKFDFCTIEYRQFNKIELVSTIWIPETDIWILNFLKFGFQMVGPMY